MRPLINRTGEKFITNEGYEIEIIEYFGANNCTIRFDDGVVLKNKFYHFIQSGSISNPFYKSIYKKGFIGEGKYKNPLNMFIFTFWKNMLRRCYSKEFQFKNPSYKGVTVCDEWYNFQNFAKWFEENYVDGFSLDKDILSTNNKLYSPETCCFVPKEINSLFTKRTKKENNLPTGVYKHRKKFRIFINNNYVSFNTPEEAFQAYKTAKEQYIKEVAEKWRGKISEKVYQIMYNYKIKN